MPKVLNERITGIKWLKNSICKMTVKSGYISKYAYPGQFVNVKCADDTGIILRRPISICNVDKDKNEFDIVFMLKGKGTRLLSRKKRGDFLDFIGPLGNGFTISARNKKVLIAGGGIGTFPLLFLLKELPHSENSCCIGFRSCDNAVLVDELSECSNDLILCTDDGSLGKKGFVTYDAEQVIKLQKPNIIYACGPHEMMKEISRLANLYGVKCQVSLEQRMGCGIGACLVCACKIRTTDKNGWKYSHVCKDGPVFLSDEVIFE